jgi:hypothetical protein
MASRSTSSTCRRRWPAVSYAGSADAGYAIVSGQGTRVFLPGFPSRVYDFVLFDPDTGSTIGAEVKTTIADTIWLNPQQVRFDVAVANGSLGPAIGSGVAVNSVMYYTYCGGCLPMTANLMSGTLSLSLQLAGVPVLPARAVKF